MKHDLVPAQQARLSKLCIEQLEKQVEENQSVLMKVLSEKEDLLAVKNQLEATVCFLENSSSEISGTTRNSLLETSETSANKPIIAPLKFSKKNNTSNSELMPEATNKNPELKTPACDKVLRRSSRSASKIANASLQMMKSPPTNEFKRSANTIDKEEDSEKRIKVKTTDTESPGKPVNVGTKEGVSKPSKLAYKTSTDDRDPLRNVTNSPAKQEWLTSRTDPDQKDKVTSAREVTSKKITLKGRNKNKPKTRDPEECKQQ